MESEAGSALGLSQNRSLELASGAAAPTSQIADEDKFQQLAYIRTQKKNRHGGRRPALRSRPGALSSLYFLFSTFLFSIS
jgi:hypothetical protein